MNIMTILEIDTDSGRLIFAKEPSSLAPLQRGQLARVQVDIKLYSDGMVETNNASVIPLDESTFSIENVIKMREQMGQFKAHYTLRKRLQRWFNHPGWGWVLVIGMASLLLAAGLWVMK